MSVLNVHLFGRFSARRDEQPVRGLEAGKVQELFCYLLLHRGRHHRREILGSLLWGDSSTAQTRKYLRQTLWQLQAAVDAPAESIHDRVIQPESDWVQLNRHANFCLDVALFERTFSVVEGLPGHELDAHSVQVLAAAEQLHQGELLEGWYQDWCFYERERLQNMHLAMLDKRMGYCETHQEYEAGLTYGARSLRSDRARERTHRQLMRLYYLAGDRTGALRQYECCLAMLHDELDVAPSKRTVALYEQIRADRLADQIELPTRASTTPPGTSVPLPELLGHLKQVRTVLADIEQQVEQDIESIELALIGRGRLATT
jgi:DNA-binding SARP family transcriptional activator